jgi:hypothetical protein
MCIAARLMTKDRSYGCPTDGVPIRIAHIMKPLKVVLYLEDPVLARLASSKLTLLGSLGGVTEAPTELS